MKIYDFMNMFWKSHVGNEDLWWFKNLLQKTIKKSSKIYLINILIYKYFWIIWFLIEFYNLTKEYKYSNLEEEILRNVENKILERV